VILGGLDPAEAVRARTRELLDGHQFIRRGPRRESAERRDSSRRRSAAARVHQGSTAMTTAQDRSLNDLDVEPVPAMQQILDNPFLLLFIGIAMPTVLYIVWGVMEIVGIPIAK
jgi:hypothetical protein